MAHFLSVLLMFYLVDNLFATQSEKSSAVALVAAVLHIISPAGIFLSAPYSESIFSAVSMLGLVFYLKSFEYRVHGNSLPRNGFIVTSGLLLGCATVLRSNGLFNGLLFLWDAAAVFVTIMGSGLTVRRVLELASIATGGICIGLGFVLPQYLAYREYCLNDSGPPLRPWCVGTMPSIYAWVQSHYWSVILPMSLYLLI